MPSRLPVGRLIAFAGTGAVLFAGGLLVGTTLGREEASQSIGSASFEASSASDAPVSEPVAARVEPAEQHARDEELARQYLADLRERTAARSPEERQRLREERADRAEAMEPELIEALRHPDAPVRAEAVSELPIEGEGELGAERVQRLARVAVEDPDPRVRIAAVERLGETDSPDAVDPLVGALSDPDPEVVLEALSALQDLDDASVLPYLEPLLQDPNPEIRDEAEFTREWLQW